METNKHEGVTVTLPLNRYLELIDKETELAKKEAELDACKRRDGNMIEAVLDDVDGRYYWPKQVTDPDRTREKNAEVLAMVMALEGARDITISETLDNNGKHCGYYVSMQVGKKDAR